MIPVLFPLCAGVIVGLAIIIPLGLKWEFEKGGLLLAALIIGVLSSGIAAIVFRLANFSVIGVIALVAAMVVALFAAYILFRFFQDPERNPKGEETQILSPADGKIIYIKNIGKGLVPISNKHGKTFRLDELTSTDLLVWGGYLVGISMSFLDVHVNRAPIGGKIVLMHRVGGLFLSLKRHDAVFRNERVVTIIESNNVQLGVIQIASRLVRSIVPFKNEGEEVYRGEKIGMIRFGSQVDLVLPGATLISLSIKVGEKVKAGESIIGKILS